ncbi:uroporphyrinogen-III synthase [Kineosphaera limosa]|uniref:OmpR/PhoB-type domain-containing protein n=1 Tax=Kineosphaera limosa NBRC 100340 TaxID=1184609 RepID=K6WR55_9MICO|nr:uroporphyrinogen-III synthase [Kineosphaera limosa]NYD99431.1 uroporphyrinogen-III synthase [Kineosphaera limosa]GAB94587.1 hypothetical protein KILIM_007_00250 [Kineosphaera limosa NBRC 100340]
MQEQLGGLRVLLTNQRRAAELGAALARRGAAIVDAPVLSIVPHADDDELTDRTRDLIADPPDVLVVTTGVGLRGWVEAADAAGLATDLLAALADTQIVARGPKAKGAILQAGLSAAWTAESETAAEVGEYLLAQGVEGRHVAVQHHGSGDDGLDALFADAGARVTPVVVYRVGPSPDPAAVARGIDLVADKQVDAVVFTSAPMAAEFLDRARSHGRFEEVVAACHPQGDVLAAAVGPVTAGPLQAVGIEPIVPDRYRLGALVRELVKALAPRAAARVHTPAGTLMVRTRAAHLEGRPLPLTPAGLAVLRLLAQAQGAVVTRAAILAELPGDSTNPHTAEMAVARLREAPGLRPLVQTVVKRGYRLDVLPDDVPPENVRTANMLPDEVRNDPMLDPSRPRAEQGAHP